MNTPGPEDWLNNWLQSQQQALRAWQTSWQAGIEQASAQFKAAGGSQPWPDLGRQFTSNFNPANLAGLRLEAFNPLHSFQQLLQSGLGQSVDWQKLLNGLPVGPAREHQQAWQTYHDAQRAYQQSMQRLLGVYSEVFAEALQAVPGRVEQLAAQGNPPGSFRQLYDLWIECGEAAFARRAQDAGFVELQAASGNALSHLKLAQQRLLEDWLKSQDLPTRSELNSVHQRLKTLGARVSELEQLLARARATARKPEPGT